MAPKKYQRLTYKDRVIIQTLLSEDKSASFISRQLERNRSSISREINKWIRYPGDEYEADLAHWSTEDMYLNKRNFDKIQKHYSLRRYVYSGLLNGLSPELIAGRIKVDFPGDPILTISHEAIYTHIYNHPQAKLNRKLIKLLLHFKSRRRRAKGHKKGLTRIKDGLSIEQRPAEVGLRKEAGHWEGDLMIGVKQSSAIGTLVERKTRFTYIVKLKNRRSKTVTKAFKKELDKMNKIFKKTMTYDNGSEMANHKWLTKKTGMKVYFAHPYSSWERGTNENTNGLIRRFLPKGINFNDVSQEYIEELQNWLNNRPRKVLQYRTSMEMVQLELLQSKHCGVSAEIENNPKQLFSILGTTNNIVTQKNINLNT
jgi:transposase, IS30 family